MAWTPLPAGTWNFYCSEFRINGTPADPSAEPLALTAIQQTLGEWWKQAPTQTGFKVGPSGMLLTADGKKTYMDGAGALTILNTPIIIGRVEWSAESPADESVTAAVAFLESFGSFLALRLSWRAVAIDFRGKELGAHWKAPQGN